MRALFSQKRKEKRKETLPSFARREKQSRPPVPANSPPARGLGRADHRVLALRQAHRLVLLRRADASRGHVLSLSRFCFGLAPR